MWSKTSLNVFDSSYLKQLWYLVDINHLSSEILMNLVFSHQWISFVVDCLTEFKFKNIKNVQKEFDDNL